MEGYEWEVLESMVESGILQSKVKQLAFEIHTPPESRTAADFYQRWKKLEPLERIGFARWHWHMNPYGINLYTFEGQQRSWCYEMFYINTAFLK